MIQLNAEGYKKIDKAMAVINPKSNMLKVYSDLKEVFVLGCPSEGNYEACTKICGVMALSLCEVLDESITPNIDYPEFLGTDLNKSNS